MAYEDDLQWEQETLARCRRLASELLDAAKELRWYSSDPVEAGWGHLDAVATERGLEREDRTRSDKARRKTKLPSRAVWDRDDWTCKRCGTHRDLTVDHIVPIIAGGTDDMDNLQTLCGSCNSRKGGR